MKQGGDEWFAARLGRLTASRMADVIATTKTGYSASRAGYAVELALERITGQGETGFTNAYGLTETSSTVALLGPDEHRVAHAAVDPEVRARLASRMGKDVSDEAIRPMLGVHIDYLSAAIEAMESRHGDVASYMKAVLDVDDEMVATLRDHFVR